MPEWDAEIELDESQVRALVASQFPALDLAGLVPFAAGWDNALWVTGEGIAFRFPRRAIALAGVAREIAVLPALAPRLPMPIPSPEWIGTPSPAYPWPFFGSRLLPGRELANARPITDRVAFASALGGFLRALHAPAVLAALGDGLPHDRNARADMSIRVPRTRERLRQTAEAGLWTPPDTVLAVLDEAASLGNAPGQALIHGDLHARHVLVDDDGRPSAIIDWGDLCVADPSVDLSLYWSVLDGESRAAFRAAYGEASLTTDRLLRARVLALFLNAALATYAADTGDQPLLHETIAGLERTLMD